MKVHARDLEPRGHTPTPSKIDMTTIRQRPLVSAASVPSTLLCAFVFGLSLLLLLLLR
jgi:hypothetical protein